MSTVGVSNLSGPNGQMSGIKLVYRLVQANGPHSFPHVGTSTMGHQLQNPHYMQGPPQTTWDLCSMLPLTLAIPTCEGPMPHMLPVSGGLQLLLHIAPVLLVWN